MITIQKNLDSNDVTDIDLPASKSISNRLLILNAFEEGIKGNSDAIANDTIVLQHVLQQIKNSTREIEILDVEDAGTAFRFLLGYCAITPGQYIIKGSKRLSERPIQPLVEALVSLGAHIEYVDTFGYAPLKIIGKKLLGGSIEMDASISSQFISSLLLIGWHFEKGLTLKLKNKIVSNEYIQMTITLLKKANINITQEEDRIVIAPNQKLQPFHLEVEKDWSSASYFYALLLGMKAGEIVFKGLKEDSIQGDKVIVEMASLFGIKTIFEKEATRISYKETKESKTLSFDCLDCPDLAQTLMVMCCIAKKNAYFEGLDTLPSKETNRIVALQNELKKFGYNLKEQGGGYFLEKEKDILEDTISVTTYKDHRMAMSFASLATQYHIVIQEPEVVKKSFPDFWNQLNKLGFKINEFI